MTTNYTATATIDAYWPDIEPDMLTFTPADTDWIRTKRQADGTTIVRYMVVDDDAHSFDTEEVIGFDNELLLFNNGHERNDWLKDNELTDRQFLLQRYEHGLVRYSVIDTRIYPDMQWDVAPGVGVLTLADDYEPNGEHSLVDIANSVMETYTDWCNGNVYGIATDTFDRHGNVINSDSVWGMIGTDWALEELGD